MGRETHAAGGVHCLKQVADERPYDIIHLINPGAFSSQHRFSV